MCSAAVAHFLFCREAKVQGAVGEVEEGEVRVALVAHRDGHLQRRQRGAVLNRIVLKRLPRCAVPEAT